MPWHTVRDRHRSPPLIKAESSMSDRPDDSRHLPTQANDAEIAGLLCDAPPPLPLVREDRTGRDKIRKVFVKLLNHIGPDTLRLDTGLKSKSDLASITFLVLWVHVSSQT